MKRTIIVLTVAIAVVGLAACSSAKINTDWDSRIDFSKYSTWNFSDSTKGTESVARAAIATAAGGQLKAAGLQRDSENPDLHVSAYGGLDESVRFENYAVSYAPYGGWGSWYGRGWEGTAIAVRSISVGTVMVDLVDIETDELVWRGVASGTIESDWGPDRIKRAIDSSVKSMFSGFPPRQ